MPSSESELNPEHTGESRDEHGRFVKGVSGNPNGRPEGTLSLVGLLKKHLEGVPEGEKKSRADIFIQKTLSDAMRGDPTSKKLVWNYVEGLPQARMDITSGGKPIPILNVPKDDSHNEDTETE